MSSNSSNILLGLVVGIFLGSIGGFLYQDTRIKSLNSEIADLSTQVNEHSGVLEDYSQLSEDFDELRADYNQIRSENNVLQNDINWWESEYNKLLEDYEEIIEPEQEPEPEQEYEYIWGPDDKTLESIPKIIEGGEYETYLDSADLSNDDFDDLLITRVNFQTYNTYPVDILINHGDSQIGDFIWSTRVEGAETQNPTAKVFEDFNQDGINDIFIADHGYDAFPHPGYQNTLILSDASGNIGSFYDATSNLPQQYDFTHSAVAGDVDGDLDMDLYIGNTWGEQSYDPMILINDGTGFFNIKSNALPILTSLHQNGYTTAEFVDVDNDNDLDLILGDHGDEISNPYSTPTSELLLNDGTGKFTHKPNAIPEKDNAVTDICHDILPYDFNKDGYMDLILSYERQPQMGSYFQLLINNKDRTFSKQTESWISMTEQSNWMPKLSLEDLNQDGHMDIWAWVDNWQTPNPYVLMNNGDNFFIQTSIDFGLNFIYYTFVDIHNDGDNDLMYVEVGDNEEYKLRQNYVILR